MKIKEVFTTGSRRVNHCLENDIWLLMYRSSGENKLWKNLWIFNRKESARIILNIKTKVIRTFRLKTHELCGRMEDITQLGAS